MAEIRRLLQIAALDTLALENSVARNRTLGNLSMALMKLLEVGDVQERLAQLEQAVRHQPNEPHIFDVEAAS